jgi:hypothetical protein
MEEMKRLENLLCKEFLLRKFPFLAKNHTKKQNFSPHTRNSGDRYAQSKSMKNEENIRSFSPSTYHI